MHYDVQVIFKRLSVKYLTRHKGEPLHKKPPHPTPNPPSSQAETADTVSREDNGPFAFTSTGDERSGRGGVGENRAG